MILNKKSIIKFIALCLIGYLVYKCDIPLNTKPGTITLDTKEDVFKTQRSLWVYKPDVDSLLVQDSLRDICFKFKDIFAYDSRYINNIHIHFFAPWAIVDYSNYKLKFVTVTTEYLQLEDKEDIRVGIAFSISGNPKSDNIKDFRHAWSSDDSIKGNSYIQTKIKYPLPDTLYLIIWGRSDIYLPYSIYKTLPDSTRYDKFSSKYNNGQMKLAQIKFILTDSVINHKSPKGIKRKLIIPWVTKL
ncbi:MAG: hypothetical protein Q7U47_15675 [Paludibacter sp.]|nr:hypothetical protein [Paludibacter sp.]